jgi:hypothetical protein
MAFFVVAQGLGLAQVLETRGLRLKCERASPGYTLFAPLGSDTTYLVNLDGQAVRTWKSALLPSAWVYLLDNGHVLRGGSDPGNSGIRGGGQGGRFQEFDFEGNLVWDFRFNEGRLPHHDVAVLPNGNVLAIVWETRTADEALRAGRRPGFVPANGIWPDMLIEFEPQRPAGARIVWEWHMWDHLVQNTDPTLDNYDDPARRPERIDINGDTPGTSAATPDVFHTNSVAYNSDLDQIILSVPTFNEIWVIDHSTTTLEASGSTGGRSGKGGDLLYRWGNPAAYGRGDPSDRLLGFQHDARWIPPGRPGAGNMTVFSNRTPGPAGAYSKVYELSPPVDAEGRYSLAVNSPFGPEEPVWTYSDPDSLQANLVSGAERLETGNTLISSGPNGRLFEVTPAGSIVWEYWSPYGGAGANGFIFFRAVKIGPGHPGLAGRDLRPLDPQPPGAAVSLGTPANCPRPLPPPTLTGIQPSAGARGSQARVTLTGTVLVSPVVAVSGQGVAVSDVQADSPESLTAVLTITDDAALGVRDVTLTTAGGTARAAFAVLPAQPGLTGIVPRVGVRGTGAPLLVTLTGTNFLTGLAVEAGAGITAADVQVIDSTRATARFFVEDIASPGPRDVMVTTDGGTSGSVRFTVADPFPDLAIRSSHTGSFAAGFDESYAIAVTNDGTAPAAGRITVADLLPAGLTFVSSAGDGWSCTATGPAVMCTGPSALAPGESTQFALTVAVGGNASSPLHHSPSVSVEGDLNDLNDHASDATTIMTPSPLIVLTPDPLIPGQPARIAVTMTTPFPHDVTGSVAMMFTSNAAIPADDPAIQFSTGGRTVTFTIPANGAEARFGEALQPGPLAFQTGTVAGTLAFRGNFTAGTVPGELFARSGAGIPTIPLQAPSILNVQTNAVGGHALSMLLLSTPREVRTLSLSFNTNPKVQLSCGVFASCRASGNTLTLDVAALFTQWFSGETAFGGLAQLKLPFDIRGGAVAGTITVTLRNAQGVSNSVSIPLH